MAVGEILGVDREAEALAVVAVVAVEAFGVEADPEAEVLAAVEVCPAANNVRIPGDNK